MSIFSKVAARRPKKSTFDLSHDVKMSIGMGKLVPFYVEEVLPGDKFKISAEAMLRMAPMIAPIMHRVDVMMDYFFVPNRLLWDGWEEFITGGKDGTTVRVPPHFIPSEVDAAVGGSNPRLFTGNSTLYDYLGCPAHFFDSQEGLNKEVQAPVSLLPFAAYGLIYNEYYRDQNLQNPLNISLGDGKRTFVSGPIQNPQYDVLRLQNRAWRKDYFTSALPWAQRGPDAVLPLGQTAPVITSGLNQPLKFKKVDGGSFVGATTYNIQGYDNTTGQPETVNAMAGGASQGGQIQPANLVADLSQATATTVNDLRKVLRLQQWLERNARGGARYIEQILSHFGVKSSDARLQRPEYLGGAKNPLMISEVLQTSESDQTPQGNMSGHGISAGHMPKISRFFEEHGFIIGIISVLPKTAYQDGLPRGYSRLDKFDYYFPEFANLGEQEIKIKELYAYLHQVESDRTFGYTPRYAEYKYRFDRVAGEFRQSLDHWHMGRKFANAPALNEDFVKSSPTNRIFAVTDLENEQLYVLLRNKVRASRPMPYFGTPSIV